MHRAHLDLEDDQNLFVEISIYSLPIASEMTIPFIIYLPSNVKLQRIALSDVGYFIVHIRPKEITNKLRNRRQMIDYGNVTWHRFILANTDVKVNSFVTFVGYTHTNRTTQYHFTHMHTHTSTLPHTSLNTSA